MKVLLKEQAIKLRKGGRSYSEIRKLVPVSKSTLGLWFKSVKLSKQQIQTLTNKRLEAANRGGLSRKLTRLRVTREIISSAKLEIGTLSSRELRFTGLALYWAEGSKAKENNPSQGVTFSNSDTRMLKVFLKWLLEILKIPKKKIIFELYIHQSYSKKAYEIRKYWAKRLSLPIGKFDRIYYKKNKIKRTKYYYRKGYNGLIRIRVLESTNLNRKIAGWIEGISEYCGVV